LSTYGTLGATHLDAFVPDHHSRSEFPWGSLTAENSNPESDAPFTGVTREYKFTVERAVISPDGVQKEALLINGQFPGPLIEANWGDTISVTVHNNITQPDEGTSLHVRIVLFLTFYLLTDSL
jgi:FtsP/CotA-like multicopper oxidase with cupredoxin domain